MRVVFNSKKANVKIRKIIKQSKPENVKIVFTLKPRVFSEDGAKGPKVLEALDTWRFWEV